MTRGTIKKVHQQYAEKNKNVERRCGQPIYNVARQYSTTVEFIIWLDFST